MQALRASAPGASLLILFLSAVALAADATPVPARPIRAPRQALQVGGPPVVGRGVRRETAGQSLLADLVDRAEVVCLAELISQNSLANGQGNARVGIAGGRRFFVRMGVGTYNVVRVAKCPGNRNLIHPLDDIEAQLTTAKKGDLCLMVGRRYGGRRPQTFWFAPIPISEDAFDYAIEAPPPSAPPNKQVDYFSGFLFSSDEQIADDALGEIGRLSYGELIEVKALFSEDVRAQCRRALADAKTSLSHRALLARLIGSFGTEQDAALLEPECFGDHANSGEALKQMTAGYLRLAGENGFDKVDRALVAARNGSHRDAQAIFDAICLVGDELPATIPRERLLRSIRLFLDWPDQFLPASAVLARLEHRSAREQFAHFAGFLEAKNAQIAAQALVEVSHYSVLELPDNFPRERFLRSVRAFLDRPDQLRTAIAVLSLWEGWTPRDRMAHFASFLGSSNRQLADAAVNEFNRCSHRQLADGRNLVPKAFIEDARHRFADPKTSPLNRALAARILGTCGTRQDLALLEAAVSGPRPELPYLTTELAIAYILLSDKQGLDKIDQWLLKDPDATSEDAHVALDAIVTIAEEFPDRIEKDRLLRSVRLLLDWPDEAWRAIRFLIRQRDWSVHDRLMALYGSPNSVPLTKWEIVRYLFTALHAPRSGQSGDEPQKWAAKSIEELRKKDPELVADVEQSFPGTGSKR